MDQIETTVGVEKSPDQLMVEKLGLTQPLTTIDFKAPQILGHHQIRTKKKVILSMDKGMGKTITYVSAAFREGAVNVIICCTRNAMASQRRDILAFIPEWADKYIFVQGTAAQRAKAWADSSKPVKIMTPATLQADMGLRAKSKDIAPKAFLNNLDVLDADEFHRYLRRRSSGMMDVFRALKPEQFVLASGSAVS